MLQSKASASTSHRYRSLFASTIYSPIFTALVSTDFDGSSPKRHLLIFQTAFQVPTFSLVVEPLVVPGLSKVQAGQQHLLACRLCFCSPAMSLLYGIRSLQPKEYPLSQCWVVDFSLLCPGHCEISPKAQPIVWHHLLAPSTYLVGHNLKRPALLPCYVHHHQLALKKKEREEYWKAFIPSLWI